MSAVPPPSRPVPGPPACVPSSTLPGSTATPVVPSGRRPESVLIMPDVSRRSVGGRRGTHTAAVESAAHLAAHAQHSVYSPGTSVYSPGTSLTRWSMLSATQQLDGSGIALFLEALDLSQYTDAFANNDINDVKDLGMMDDTHFAHLGITIGHRIRIQKEILVDKQREQEDANAIQNARKLARARLDLESGDRRSKSIQSVLLVATLLTAASASFLVGEMEAVAWGDLEELSPARSAAVILHTTCVTMDLYCVMMLGMLDFVLIVAMDPVGAGGSALAKARDLITAESAGQERQGELKDQQDIATQLDKFNVFELDMLLRSVPGWKQVHRNQIIKGRGDEIVFLTPEQVPEEAEGAVLYDRDGPAGCYVKEFQFRFCDPNDLPTAGCGGCEARQDGNSEVLCKPRFGWLWACRNCGRAYYTGAMSTDDEFKCNTVHCVGAHHGEELIRALETRKTELERRMAQRRGKTKVSGIRNELGTHDQREIAAGTRTFEFLANHQIKFHREMAVKVTILSIPVMVVAVLMSCIANFGNDDMTVGITTGVTGSVLLIMLFSIYSVLIHARRKVKAKRIQAEKTWIAERDVTAKKVSKSTELQNRVDRGQEQALRNCVQWCIRTAKNADDAKNEGVIRKFFGTHLNMIETHNALENALANSDEYRRATFKAAIYPATESRVQQGSRATTMAIGPRPGRGTARRQTDSKSANAGDVFRRSNTSVDGQGQPMLRLRHSGSIGSNTPVTPSVTSRPASVISQASIATLRLDSQVSDTAHEDHESFSESSETPAGLSSTMMPGGADIAEIPGSAKRSRRNTPLITVEDHDAQQDAPVPAEIFHEAGYEGSNMVANPMYGKIGKV